MLLLALPFLIWLISGSYFVFLDLGFIRGDHYRPQQSSPLHSEQISYPLAEVLKRYPDAHGVRLTNLDGHPYYQLSGEQSLLIDAENGRTLLRVSAAMASRVAQANVPMGTPVTAVIAIYDEPPSELSARHLPVWQVSFDDRLATRLYVSMETGEVVTRRHDLWRLFDWFWRFHIMDYDDGADIDNPLLTVSTLLALIAVLAGIWLQAKRWRRGRI